MSAPGATRAGEEASVLYFRRLEEACLEAGEVAGWVERELEIDGRRLRLRFAGPALVDVVLPALAHREVEPGGGSALTIGLWDSASTGVGVPRFPWRREDLLPRGAVRGFHGERIRTAFDGSAPMLSMSDAEGGTIFWAADPRCVPWYERAAPLRAALHWLLTGPRRHLVHAGAVAGSAGAALLVGKSGSGKSTTAVAAMAGGLGFLGDDYVFLSLAEEPVAHSLFGTAKVDARGLGLLRATGAALPTPDAVDLDRKSVLDLAAFRPERIRPSAPVVAVVIPEPAGARCARLEPASGANGLRALAPSTIVQMPHEARAALELMAELVRRVPTYRLVLGRDVSAVPAVLGELVAR